MKGAILVIVSVVLAVCGGQQCIDGGVYDATFNNCYQYLKTAQSWRSAKDVCGSLNGRLVDIHNAFEESFIFGNARQKLTGDSYWIGLSATEDPNVYVWEDGIDSTYTFWDTGYPVNDTNKRCVAGRIATGRWFNTDCDNTTYSFICETQPDDSEVKCPGGGVYDESHDQCFYYIKAMQDYNTATSTCAELNAKLPTVNKDSLQQFVYKGAQEKGIVSDYWIGLTDPEDDGHWHWTGASFYECTHWDEEFPMVGANLMCAAVSNYNGKWYNTFCTDIQMYFVCQKRPANPVEVPWSSEGWTYYSVADAYYMKIHDCYGSFGNCEGACVDAGGHLVSIHSVEENQFVKTIINSSDFTWIGLHSPNEIPFKWMWTDGSPFDYTGWSRGEPSGSIDFCAAYFTTGWDNVLCNAYNPAVCKHVNSCP